MRSREGLKANIVSFLGHLQHLNVLLILRIPKLDTVLKMSPHQC